MLLPSLFLILAVSSLIINTAAAVFVLHNKKEFKTFVFSDVIGSVVSGTLLIIASGIEISSEYGGDSCTTHILLYSALIVSLTISSAAGLCQSLLRQQAAVFLTRRPSQTRSLTPTWRCQVQRALVLLSWCAAAGIVLLLYIKTEKSPSVPSEHNYNRQTRNHMTNESLVKVRGLRTGNLTREQITSMYKVNLNTPAALQDRLDTINANSELTYNLLHHHLGIPDAKLRDIFSSSAPDEDEVWRPMVVGTRTSPEGYKPALLPHHSSLLYQLLSEGEESIDGTHLTRPNLETPTNNSEVSDTVNNDSGIIIENNTTDDINQNDGTDSETELLSFLDVMTTNGSSEHDNCSTEGKKCNVSTCYLSEPFLKNFHYTMFVVVYLVPSAAALILYFNSIVTLYEERSFDAHVKRIKTFTIKAVGVHIIFIVSWLPLLMERLVRKNEITATFSILLLIAFSNNLFRAAFYMYTSLQVRAVQVGISEEASETPTIDIRDAHEIHESDC